MRGWATTPLGELADFRNGLNYTDADLGSGLAVIGVTDFKNNVIAELGNLAEISLGALPGPHALIHKDDIVFVRSNGNRELIGRSLFVKREPNIPTSHSGFTIRCRFHDVRCIPRFYAYLFRGPIIRQILSAQGGGTNISNLNQGIISKLTVPVPPIDVQRHIASILSCYDNFVENNTRRIAILEEMAQRIFEEWFGRFRAPGVSATDLVESSIGPVPRDWKVVRLNQVITFDPSVQVSRDDLKPFVPMTALPTNSMIVTNIEERTGNSGAKFQNGDTLLARITPCLENGKTGFVDFLPTDTTVSTGSTEFIVMRGKAVPPQFVQMLARSAHFRAHAIASMSGATGRQRVRRESLERFEIALPPTLLLDRFRDVADPIFKLCRTLADANRNLRTQRDLLLPKFTSGEIDVSGAESVMEAAE